LRTSASRHGARVRLRVNVVSERKTLVRSALPVLEEAFNANRRPWSVAYAAQASPWEPVSERVSKSIGRIEEKLVEPHVEEEPVNASALRENTQCIHQQLNGVHTPAATRSACKIKTIC